MKKILTIIICSKDRLDYINRLLDSIECNNKIKIIIIDDFSNPKYEITSKHDILLIRNNKNIHKFYSFLQTRKYINSDFICFIDDKDYFFNNITNQLVNVLNRMPKDEILVVDMYNNSKIIGKKYRSNSLLEHKNYRCDFGDKLLFIPSKLFINYEFHNSLLMDEKIYNYDFFIEDILEIKTKYLPGMIVNHEYLENGITKNNIKNKIDQFLYRSELLKIQLENKSSFKYKIYKLFERWIIRRKIKIKIHSKYLKIVNFFLNITFLYYFIYFIYILKIKKIVKD